ncbi:CopD family protein [Melaminivora jejuensis]|uniref:CopD family protein n=1 Tax=Melaminivora jejuensis TaxID=1267217 RepID=UPI001AE0C416|nr:CopD family protein [Melaminivora jejuensis]UHJ66450.1 CopD family protein [Melaminivora jejuensis]
MYPYVFSLHVLAATIWTGGHLVLALTVLPRAVRARSPQMLLQFEQSYEHVGMAALAIQIASGLWMALQLVPDWGQWFSPDTGMEQAIALKLALLAATALVAAHARLRVIPQLRPETLPLMAWHVAAITLLGVAFVLTGISFRYGGVGG